MADEENEGTEGEGEEQPKSKMMLFIIIGVVVLLLGGGGAFFLLSGGEEKKEGEEEEEVIDVSYETAILDPFIVNLSQNTRFLKAKLLIEYDPTLVYENGKAGMAAAGAREPGDPLPGILGSREPMIRDSVIRLLSSKTVSEVLSADGKEAIKEELVEVMNEASGIDEGAVTAVYYMEFIVQ